MEQHEIEKLMKRVRDRYGENHKITGDYDQSLARKCVNGTFVGKLDGDVLSFKGIPFVGEQPVGKNRWKAPVPYGKDDGVYEAYYFENAPMQPVGFSEPASFYYPSEECLYLNIFENVKNKDEKKPVMVWIHGGAFEMGGACDPLYDGSNFVKDNGDAIFVSLEYRVSVYGFIDFSWLPEGKDYPDAPNLGMLDQVMALRWVHENIAAFGGDPDNITVFGESAGGCSVTLLMLMEESRKYVRRAIAESGTPVFTRTKDTAV